MQTYVLCIDDYHPDPTQRPFLLFGPFADMQAAEKWAVAREDRYNDWQVVTASAEEAGTCATVQIFDPSVAELAWPLHPVPPMDPTLQAQIARAAQRD